MAQTKINPYDVYLIPTELGQVSYPRRAIILHHQDGIIYYYPVSTKLEGIRHSENFIISKEIYGNEFIEAGFTASGYVIEKETRINDTVPIKKLGELTGKFLIDFKDHFCL